MPRAPGQTPRTGCAPAMGHYYVPTRLCDKTQPRRVIWVDHDNRELDYESDDGTRRSSSFQAFADWKWRYAAELGVLPELQGLVGAGAEQALLANAISLG